MTDVKRKAITQNFYLRPWKFIKIILPEFGGKDKRKKQKKSGNMGFKEFPRPLNKRNGGNEE